MLRSGLLAGAGVATVGAMSAVLTGTAQAATPNPQEFWGYCQYCATMWWTNGNQLGGACVVTASGGEHQVVTGSYNYQQFNGGVSGAQPNFRWCSACSGMFWGGSAGVCWGNLLGTHTQGGTSYDLFSNAGGLGVTTDPQAYWRWCSFCSLIYWQGPSGVKAGGCPGILRDTGAVGPHYVGSDTVYDIFWGITYNFG
jgi:hypothetical protein